MFCDHKEALNHYSFYHHYSHAIRWLMIFISVTWCFRKFYASYTDTYENIFFWISVRGKYACRNVITGRWITTYFLLFSTRKAIWRVKWLEEPPRCLWGVNEKLKEKRVQERKGSNHKKGQEYERTRLKGFCVAVCISVHACVSEHMSFKAIDVLVRNPPRQIETQRLN